MKGSMMFEIILIAFSGIVTVLLSAKAVVKNWKQEIETQKYQDESKLLQQKLDIKTDEIIKLNQLLADKSESNSLALKRLSKHVPKDIFITFSAELRINEIERKALKEYFNSNLGKGNTIYAQNYQQITGMSTFLNYLMVSGLRINLEIVGKDDKRISVSYTKQPIKFMEMPLGAFDDFLLYYDSEKEKLKIDGIGLKSTSYNTNSYSLYDFELFNTTYSVKFSQPILINNRTMYRMTSEKFIVLENMTTILYFDSRSGHNISSGKLKIAKTNKFFGSGQIKLD